MIDYLANAGQTYLPFRKNIRIQPPAFTPLDRPTPAIPELELNAMAIEKKWVLSSQCQHFLPGVEPHMIDWFWANMEKGYYLWAPGSHKRFSWVRTPCQYGFIRSAHMISESVGAGYPVFGGDGIQINRLDLSWFPFTTALEHVIVEGVFNDLGEFVDMTVHMWDACPGGSRHITASVASTTLTQPPAFVLQTLAENPDTELLAPGSSDHSEYEASRWPQFLPTLYHLWENHPDPSQSVPCDLTVRQTGKDTWEYVKENGPIEV